jgi:predicted restriction endonuclease
MCKVTKNNVLFDKKALHIDKKNTIIWGILTKEVSLQHKLKELFTINLYLLIIL